MRIVLDTNVVMSALLWRGKPYQLLEAIRQRDDMQLWNSPELLEELAEVLLRPSASRRLTVIGKTAREVLADYIEAVDLVESMDLARVVPNDPDDDCVIATAIAAQASLIVSGDQDLVSMESHRGIDIQTPAMAIEALRASEG